MLLGRKLVDGNLAGVAEWVEQNAHPEADYLGGYEYRVEMAKTLTLRALRGCVAQLMA
jgi:CO/xanthine dehydrogenase FAD-binding subunit